MVGYRGKWQKGKEREKNRPKRNGIVKQINLLFWISLHNSSEDFQKIFVQDRLKNVKVR